MSSPETRTVAFMDMGTNSIRLLLVRLHPNHSYTILTQLKQIVRLGEGEFTHRYLQPQAMARAVARKVGVDLGGEVGPLELEQPGLDVERAFGGVQPEDRRCVAARTPSATRRRPRFRFRRGRQTTARPIPSGARARTGRAAQPPLPAVPATSHRPGRSRRSRHL